MCEVAEQQISLWYTSEITQDPLNNVILKILTSDSGNLFKGLHF